jgi:hypothetical protein
MIIFLASSSLVRPFSDVSLLLEGNGCSITVTALFRSTGGGGNIYNAVSAPSRLVKVLV